MSGAKSAITATTLAQHAAELFHAHLTTQIVQGGRTNIKPPIHTPNQAELDQMVIDAAHKAMAALGLHPSDGKTPPPPPKPHMDSLVLNTGPIGFDSAPVGGNCSLSLFPDGAYNFSGHFHDSGFPSYDVEFVWVVGSSKGTAFVFQHKGRLHGTTESGSRDENWNDSGQNKAIADAWDALSAGNAWHWNAAVNCDLGQLVDAATKAVGVAAKVVTIVAS